LILSTVLVLATLTPGSAFALATTDAPDTPAAVQRALPADAAPAVVAAAAMGLGGSSAPGADREIIQLALSPSRPAIALEALARQYRAHPPQATGTVGSAERCFRLPDPRLLQFAVDASAPRRAAFGTLCQLVKDPALVPPLIRLAGDPVADVRRAAALGLSDRSTKSGGGAPRAGPERASCLSALTALLGDSDSHVRIAACRAVGSYGAALAGALPVSLLTARLSDPDFNVRVAALESLGRCAAVEADGQTPGTGSFPTKQMLALALRDPSVSVRYTAAVQLAGLDPILAESCVELLLGRQEEYLRSAAAEVLGKQRTPAAYDRLAQLARLDPHIRVRETAMAQLGLPTAKDAPQAKATMRWALSDSDPEIFAAACDAAGQNQWREFAGPIAAALPRFPGCVNADARASAIGALVALAGANGPPASAAAIAQVRAVLLPFRADPHPAVRMAALTGLATLDHLPPPALSRGADFSGVLYPGGRPVFGPQPLLVLETDAGTMKIRLYPDQAPITCGHVAALARAGFYNGLTWHRVVPDFVIQGGCPRGDGDGNAGVSLPLESTRIPFVRGTLGLPRDTHPDTGGCQLFICHSRAPHLDVQYCAFGQVVAGIEVVDRIDVDSRIRRAWVEGLR
jgi:cyclophilin family peptidyl-prolyl cis-trans isomerase/HEAT repeat protein